MTTSSKSKFDQQYRQHLQHLKLKGLRSKTIDAYSRAIRRIGGCFDHEIDMLSKQQLTDYFCDLLISHSGVPSNWPEFKLQVQFYELFEMVSCDSRATMQIPMSSC